MVSRMFPAFDHRDFRRMWGGAVASSVALWTLLLGRAWLVYDLSGSSSWVGVATFASMSPFLLAPLGGTVADRFDRRTVVLWARAGSLTTAILLALLTATGVVVVWHVVALAFAAGILRSVEMPAEQALLANVVPERSLMSAISLSSVAQHGSRVAGPVIAGPLLTVVGPEGAFAIAALCYLLSLGFVSTVATRRTGGATELSAVGANLAEAWRAIASTPSLALMFWLVAAHCSLTMSFDSLLPGFADGELHAGSGGFTIMVVGVGAGALVGTLLLSGVGNGTTRGLLLFLMALASGLTAIATGVSAALPAATASAVGMGASQAMFMALSAVMIQSVVPDAVRGRVMSLYVMVAGGIMAFANLGFGSLADLWGAGRLFWAPGLTFTLLVAVTLGLSPRLRLVYRRGALAPA